MDHSDIQACKELVTWWNTGFLDQEGELARQAESHPVAPGDMRMAERDLIERTIRWIASDELEALATDKRKDLVEAWKVEFENGAVELHPASEIHGEPGFGRWVTPLIGGGPTVDNAPDDNTE